MIILEAAQFQSLIDALQKRGYRTIGPRYRDHAIVYDDIQSAADLPIGWNDEQSGGRYRLKKGPHPTLFGYVLGASGWKSFLHPPRVHMWTARKENGTVQIQAEPHETKPMAFIGVRACELRAIYIQDRILLNGTYTDKHYQQSRDQLFIIAVNCSQSASTCFCTSMGSGPEVNDTCDLILTEMLTDSSHLFLIKAASQQGKELLQDLPQNPAQDTHLETARKIIADTTAQIKKTMNTKHIRDDLYTKLESPAWDEVAKRCLTCGNCTMVCPTCFCTTVENITDLSGKQAEHWRHWDSCFTSDFSYLHGGAVRQSIKSRYRQWLTHKLAGWQDQFDTLGCVGCGRCITWCPVGIDLVEMVAVLRQKQEVMTQ